MNSPDDPMWTPGGRGELLLGVAGAHQPRSEVPELDGGSGLHIHGSSLQMEAAGRRARVEAGRRDLVEAGRRVQGRRSGARRGGGAARRHALVEVGRGPQGRGRVREEARGGGEDGAGAARRPHAGGDGTGVALEVEGGGGEPALDPGGDRW